MQRDAVTSDAVGEPGNGGRFKNGNPPGKLPLTAHLQGRIYLSGWSCLSLPSMMTTKEPEMEALQTDRESTRSKQDLKKRCRKCALCLKKLDETYKKPLCPDCTAKILTDEQAAFREDIRSLVREEVRASISSLPPAQREKRATKRASHMPLTSSESEQSLGDLSDGELFDRPPDSRDENRKYYFSSAELDDLIKAVRDTMKLEDVIEPRSVQDDMFGGLRPRNRIMFPVNDTLKKVITDEWASADRHLYLSREYKERLRFAEEDVNIYEDVPKVDAQVARMAKKTALPFEDSSHLKDPMDNRVDALMKRAWQTTAYTLESNIAATSVARSMFLWLGELDDQIKQKAPRDALLECMPLLKSATGFLADASAESMRLAARSAALSNMARRAVWLKTWKADTASKGRLCNIPFHGRYIFGADLEEILKRATDKTHSFPDQARTGFSHKRQPSFRPYRGKGKTGRWSYPKGGRGKPKTTPTPIEECQVGGRLLKFSREWQGVTDNPWVLQLIAQGYRIEFFTRPPPMSSESPPHNPQPCRISL
ncbi:uncharacterized protein [Eleutherodactylus coqui]|uniref:uncharacterized protein n=1 Tax=Eleutherodactylus coqui TaxID=57060 RepID=UPI0034618BDC